MLNLRIMKTVVIHDTFHIELSYESRIKNKVDDIHVLF